MYPQSIKALKISLQLSELPMRRGQGKADLQVCMQRDHKATESSRELI